MTIHARSLLAALALACALLLPSCATQHGADAASAPTTAQDPPLARAGEEVFYHVFFRSFADGDGDRIGDLAGMTARLDYLRDLGITSILLTPLQPSPFYHNYFPTDFEAIDPAYGTLDDYRAFLRAAHARGLKVYLDIEMQYVGEGHPWWTQSLADPASPYADYLLWRDRARGQAEPFLTQDKWEGYDGRWHGIAMIDMNKQVVRDYFMRTLLWWVDPHGDGSGRDGADGFRIDHMMDDLDHKGLATDLFASFWKPIFDALRERRPGFRIMAEQADWGYGIDWLVRGHADLVFAFPLRGAIGKLDKGEIAKALRETERLTPAGKSRIVFIENHDTDRSMSLFGGDRRKARAAAAIMLVARGEPLLYYGQELGMRGITGKVGMSDGNHVPLREAMRWSADLDAPGSATWYRGDGSVRWWIQRYNRSGDGVSVQEQEGDAASLLEWYRRLLALRAQRPELRHGSQSLPCDDAGGVLCLLREADGRRTLLLVNLGKADARATFGGDGIGDGWHDLLDEGRTAADPAAIALPPLGVRVLGAGHL